MTAAGESAAEARRFWTRVLGTVVTLALPGLLALISVPVVARRLEPAAFGLVTLIWSAMGWFAMLDVGLARAVTRRVAERRGHPNEAAMVDDLWGAVWLGVIGAGTLGLLGLIAAPWIVVHWLEVPTALARDATLVVRVLAVALPVVVQGIIVRGALEGLERFAMANLARAPMVGLTYLGPMLIVLFGGGVVASAATVLAARVAYLCGQLLLLRRLMPGGMPLRGPSRVAMAVVARAGAWITVSAVATPVLLQGDRMALPRVVPIADFGWYASVLDAASRLWLLTSALQPVVFPALVRGLAAPGGTAVPALRRAIDGTAALLLPPAVLLALGGAPLLRWWLGPAFHPDAVVVFEWALLGVLAGGFAHVAYAVLQAGDGARPVGLLHLGQLPIVLVGISLSAACWGARGVAAVWMLRLVIDAALVWAVVARQRPDLRAEASRAAWWAAGGLVAISAAAAQ
ncbi:MAG: oligosaccharide flippase family protein [Gemmatimonadetes bacterium]|nr:oligosaccharide flippase family protein [Gemmatimonadota bacterium]